jgi:hypothetical protein
MQDMEVAHTRSKLGHQAGTGFGSQRSPRSRRRAQDKAVRFAEEADEAAAIVEAEAAEAAEAVAKAEAEAAAEAEANAALSPRKKKRIGTPLEVEVYRQLHGHEGGFDSRRKRDYDALAYDALAASRHSAEEAAAPQESPGEVLEADVLSPPTEGAFMRAGTAYEKAFYKHVHGPDTGFDSHRPRDYDSLVSPLSSPRSQRSRSPRRPSPSPDPGEEAARALEPASEFVNYDRATRVKDGTERGFDSYRQRSPRSKSPRRRPPLRGHEETAPAAPVYQPPTFDELDTNNDGTLSREEYSRGGQQQAGDPSFDEVDANHDGKVDREEFEAMRPSAERSTAEASTQASKPVTPSSMPTTTPRWTPRSTYIMHDSTERGHRRLDPPAGLDGGFHGACDTNQQLYRTPHVTYVDPTGRIDTRVFSFTVN